MTQSIALKGLKVYALAFSIGLVSIIPTKSVAALPTDGYANLVEETAPAVVFITAKNNGIPNFGGLPLEGIPEGSPLQKFLERQLDPRMTQPRRPTSGVGSGFLIDSNGTIVTNHHVVEGADEIEVKLSDGRTFEAKVVGLDPKTDLAVIDIEGENLPTVNFGDSDTMRVGDIVVAIGNPFGLGGSVSAGIISARGRDIGSGPYDDYIQTDAAINQGNSGGPLFNTKGEVIGINTAIYAAMGGGSVGIGFAIPSNMAQKVVDGIMKNGEVERGWLGVRIQPLSKELAAALKTDSDKGVLIAEVYADSPAENNLSVGDVIKQFDGKPIESVRDLPIAVANTPIGKEVEVNVIRNGMSETLKVTISKLSETEQAETTSQGSTEPSNAETYGLVLETDKTSGSLYVAEVVVGSSAERDGFSEGDIIVRIGEKDVKSKADVDESLASDETLLVLIEREGLATFLAIKK